MFYLKIFPVKKSVSSAETKYIPYLSYRRKIQMLNSKNSLNTSFKNSSQISKFDKEPKNSTVAFKFYSGQGKPLGIEYL